MTWTLQLMAIALLILLSRRPTYHCCSQCSRRMKFCERGFDGGMVWLCACGQREEC